MFLMLLQMGFFFLFHIGKIYNNFCLRVSIPASQGRNSHVCCLVVAAAHSPLGISVAVEMGKLPIPKHSCFQELGMRDCGHLKGQPCKTNLKHVIEKLISTCDLKLKSYWVHTILDQLRELWGLQLHKYNLLDVQVSVCSVRQL